MTARTRIAIGTCTAVVVSLAATATAGAAFPGTNGKIVYTHTTTGSGIDREIFTIDPSGQNNVQLTDTAGPSFDPSWSADGERIVFSRDPDAGGPAQDQIWVMNHDGSGQTAITTDPAFEDTNPSFSPDGRRIAFQRDDGIADDQIYVMNADGSNPVQLTFPGPSNGDEGLDPRFSPDGQKIAFRFDDGTNGDDEIWLMNANGSNQEALTTASPTAQDNTADWSPDGRRIVFSRDLGPDRDLYTVSVDDRSVAELTNSPGGVSDADAAYAPDGTRIVFERNDPGLTFANLFFVDPTGVNQGIAPLTTNVAPVLSLEPEWQPLNAPDCSLSGDAKQKSTKSVALTVTCQNENASVVAEGTGAAPKLPKAGATASKKKKFTIPAVTAQVTAGAPTTVTLAIPKKGKKALKKATKAGKKGKATITATLTDDLGQSSTETFEVTFKPKKKKK